MDAFSLNLRHLRAVHKIAALGSLNAAAAALNVTQPALTQGIARLEGALDIQLFERRPDGMTPTAAGQALAVRVEAALDLIGSPRVTSAQASAFLAVARTGSYALAARATGLKEPSLHRAVRELEFALGTRLLERRGRGLALSRRGRATARRFRLAQRELEAGLSELSSLRGRTAGRIAIGAMPLSRARILPAALVAFMARHPEVDVTVVEGSHLELLEPLRDGDLDLLIGALREPGPGPDLRQAPLFEDHPVILARHGHPLSQERLNGADPARLQAFPWIVPEPGVPLRSLWERIFTEAGIGLPPVPVTSGSVILIRQILLETDCLTILSPDQVAVELEAGWLTCLCRAPDWLARTIGVTTRADWRPTPIQQDLLDILAHLASVRTKD